MSDAQWAVLEPMLPPAKRAGPGRPREIDPHRVVDVLRYLNRTGCQWRLLPKEFPTWNTVRYYVDQWSQDGTLERLNEQLRERVRRPAGEAQPSAAILDTKSVRTTEVGGERGFDGGKKKSPDANAACWWTRSACCWWWLNAIDARLAADELAGAAAPEPVPPSR